MRSTTRTKAYDFKHENLFENILFFKDFQMIIINRKKKRFTFLPTD
jgi:hypothetical protein